MRFSVRKLGIWALASVLVALTASEMTFRPAAGASPFVIDVMLPLTGSAAFSGKDMAEALGVFEQYANRNGGLRGQPIHFNILDDASSPQTAVSLANQIIAKHPAAFLGPALTGTCSAIVPLVADNGPVDYCFSPGINPKHGSFVYAANMTLNTADGSIIRFMRIKKWNRIAILVSTDASGQANEKAFDDVLALPENKGLTIVAKEHFSPTDVSVAAQAARIKTAQPDAILALAFGTPFGTVLRGFADAGLAVPVMTTGANYNPAQLAQYTSFMPPELYLTGYPYLVPNLITSKPLKAAIANFLAAFRAAHVKPSPGSATYVWDPASLVLAALRTIGPNATAAQVRDFIAKQTDFVGVNGRYDFSNDQHGLTDEAQVIVRWDPKAGDAVPVSKPGAGAIL